MNNYNYIIPFITFKEEDNKFLHLQIIKRKKDTKDAEVSSKTIAQYYVTSIEYLNKIMPDIIKICDVLDARAYINLNVKSFDHLAKELLILLSQRFWQSNFAKIPRLLSHAAGSIKTDNRADQKWIIDIDKENINQIYEIIKFLEVTSVKIYAQIPTKSGIHIITSPFNSNLFYDSFGCIDIHTNNPTVLYIPETLM